MLIQMSQQLIHMLGTGGWDENYYDVIDVDPIGNTQDISIVQDNPYSIDTGVTIVTNAYVTTTTGTGSKANTAITGSGGGRISIAEEAGHYKLR